MNKQSAGVLGLILILLAIVAAYLYSQGRLQAAWSLLIGQAAPTGNTGGTVSSAPPAVSPASPYGGASTVPSTTSNGSALNIPLQTASNVPTVTIPSPTNLLNIRLAALTNNNLAQPSNLVYPSLISTN